MSEKPSRSTAFRFLVLWISSGRGVIYANSAFCEYIGVPVDQIVGRDPRELAALASGEIAEFFENPLVCATPNRLLADAESRIFELKTTSRQGVTDLIFDEVSSVESLENFLAPVSGIPFDQLGEDELRTARSSICAGFTGARSPKMPTPTPAKPSANSPIKASPHLPPSPENDRHR